MLRRSAAFVRVWDSFEKEERGPGRVPGDRARIGKDLTADRLEQQTQRVHL